MTRRALLRLLCAAPTVAAVAALAACGRKGPPEKPARNGEEPDREREP